MGCCCVFFYTLVNLSMSILFCRNLILSWVLLTLRGLISQFLLVKFNTFIANVTKKQ